MAAFTFAETRTPIMMSEGTTGDENRDTRTAFIRNVYIIFLIQLLFMLAFVAILYYVNVLHEFVLTYDWLLFVAYARFLIASLLFLYFKSVRRKVPWNYICIFVCTESLANVLAYFTYLLNFERLLISLAGTAVMALITILVAIRGLFGVIQRTRLLCPLVIFVLTLIICFCFLKSKEQGFGSCIFGIFVFSLNLLQCNQLILGKKYQYALKSDEHLLGAVFLFISVIILVICLTFMQWSAQQFE